MKKALNIVAIVAALVASVVTVTTQADVAPAQVAALASTPEDGPASSLVSALNDTGWFEILAVVFGSFWSPLVTEGLKKIKWVTANLAAPANLAFSIAFWLACWYFLGGYDGLPTSPKVWLGIALGSAVIGQSGRSAWKNRDRVEAEP